MTYWVYILANKPGGTLYIGVTNNLVRRVYEHRESLADGFTKRYGIKTLVYFESLETIAAALQREKEYQTLVARVENRSDRCEQPRLARSVRRYCPLARTMDCRVKPGNDE
jgi:predicted GIY-YIG superfamily endonuclease